MTRPQTPHRPSDRAAQVQHAASVDRERVAIAERQRKVFRRRLLAVRASRLKDYHREFQAEISRLRRGEPAGKNRKLFAEGAETVGDVLELMQTQRQTTAELRTPSKDFIRAQARFEAGGADAAIALAIAGSRLIQILLKMFGSDDDPPNREERRKRG